MERILPMNSCDRRRSLVLVISYRLVVTEESATSGAQKVPKRSKRVRHPPYKNNPEQKSNNCRPQHVHKQQDGTDNV